MAILKQRLSRKNAAGGYDPVHLETSSDLVLRPDGTTAEDSFTAIMQEVQGLSEQPTTPEAHSSSHSADGSDPITPESINALAQSAFDEFKTKFRHGVDGFVTVVVGTTASGHTSADCDLLCEDGVFDEERLFSNSISAMFGGYNDAVVLQHAIYNETVVLVFLPGTYTCAGQFKSRYNLIMVGANAPNTHGISVTIISNYTTAYPMIEYENSNGTTCKGYTKGRSCDAAFNFTGQDVYLKGINFRSPNAEITVGCGSGSFCQAAITNCSITALYVGNATSNTSIYEVRDSYINKLYVQDYEDTSNSTSKIDLSNIDITYMNRGDNGYTSTIQYTYLFSNCNIINVYTVCARGTLFCNCILRNVKLDYKTLGVAIFNSELGATSIVDSFSTLIEGCRMSSVHIKGASQGTFITGCILTHTTNSWNDWLYFADSAKYNFVVNNMKLGDAGGMQNTAGDTNIYSNNYNWKKV